MLDLEDRRRRLTGTKQVLRALEQGKLEKAYVASDADAFIRSKIEQACADGGVPLEKVPSMLELGRACGIQVKAAVAGMLKPVD